MPSTLVIAVFYHEKEARLYIPYVIFWPLKSLQRPVLVPLRFELRKVVSLQVESGQLYHVTTPSFGSQPISEGKSWIPTNQIGGIQKDRYSWPLSVTLQSL